MTARAGDALVFECLPGTEIEIELPEGYLSKTRTESGETVFAVYRAASLRGRVCEPDGTPLAGARVTYGAQRCETGADGAFAFENLFPEETEALRLTPPAGYLVCGAQAEEIALADGEAREITLTAMRPARVEGVLTEEGKPLAGMRVRLNEAETETDEKGRFAFDGLVLGEYALAFETLGRHGDRGRAGKNRNYTLGRDGVACALRHSRGERARRGLARRG